MTSHVHLVQAQFDPQAQAYLHSAVHAQGPDLAFAQRLVAAHLAHDAQALDVGCGAGHLSFAVAPHVARVVAFDASAAMLGTVAHEAARRDLPQVQTECGEAERLPFAEASFDLVCTRYSAHHWTDLDAALREMRRVLKPGGWLLVIDVQGDENPLVDTHLQAMELLRDRSHVRNRSVSEWGALLARLGLGAVQHVQWPTRLDFSSWVIRMRTPPAAVAMLRALQLQAPQEVQTALAQEPDGSFTVQTGLWMAQVSPVRI